MEGFIIVVSVLVILWVFCSTPQFNPFSGKLTPDDSKPVETPTEEKVVDNTPKFSPPVYELEQWIKDNWKKIKVTKLYDNISNTHTLWKVESDIVNCEISVYPHHMLYGSTGLGLDGEEVTYLVKLYRSLVIDRQVKLHRLKEQRSRKQLARKLQQLGYGSGEYESK